MIRISTIVLCVIMLGSFGVNAEKSASVYKLRQLTIVADKNADATTRLAAEELRSYIYQLTGEWVQINDVAPANMPAVILRSGISEKIPVTGPDKEQNFALYTEGDSPSGRSSMAPHPRALYGRHTR